MVNMGNNYWIKYTFSNELWQNLKHNKINSRVFKEVVAHVWDYTIILVETMIREEFIEHYYAKIMEKLENYSLKTFNKSITELHSLPRRDLYNSKYKEFLNFGWNPYYYLNIENLSEGFNTNGISEFSSHRFGNSYENDVRLFESRDTDEKSLLVIQIFYYIFRSNLEESLDWASQKGYNFSSFDQLTLNFPEGNTEKMDQIIKNFVSKPDGYTVEIDYSDKGEEILRETMNKTWFDKCFDEAWTHSIRKFHILVKEHQNDSYIEKILNEIEKIVESSQKKSLATINGSDLLEDKFFRDFYEFNPEEYILCCPFGQKLILEEGEPPICDFDGKTLLPNIGLFFIYESSLTSRGKTQENKELIRIFYSTFVEIILKLTKWDKEELEEIIDIEMNLDDA